MGISRKLENDTLRAMIAIYCHEKHKTKGNELCSKCKTLLNYASQRIDRCFYGDQKPACAKCSVHCYKAEMREEIKKVMQYSGPRMLYKHPMLTTRYYYRKLFKSKTP